MGEEDTYQKYLELVALHRRMVWTLCWNYAKSDSDRCRDYVQAVSLALFRSIGSLRQGASPGEQREWVSLVTRRTLRDLHRRKRPNTQWLCEALEELSGEDPRKEARQQAWEMIETLPEADRTIMQMRFEGYSNEEIAQLRGTTASNVSHRIRRIVKTLKKRYNP